LLFLSRLILTRVYSCLISLDDSFLVKALHADIYHLYEHAHLPPHYVNLFMPAVITQEQVHQNDTSHSSSSVEDLVSSSSSGNHKSNPSMGSLIGQTAFVAGSHVMSECARLTLDQREDTREDGASESAASRATKGPEAREASRSARIAKLIRPHLSCGDVVLFDCRILHFGLANRARTATKAGGASETGVSVPRGNNGDEQEAVQTWRPTLYANITQRWFEDKKNWESTALFSGDERLLPTP
jgi:ectoine hydroxylase-related dioxygenase (phytanoyl-CoA dioxygenase family)